jgi:serine/threonine-protein phosphatase 2A regulatory subunit B'
MVVNIVIPHLDHVIEMIEKNIFRPLPIIKKTNAPGEMGMEEDEVILDPSWPHLQASLNPSE